MQGWNAGQIAMQGYELGREIGGRKEKGRPR